VEGFLILRKPESPTITHEKRQRHDSHNGESAENSSFGIDQGILSDEDGVCHVKIEHSQGRTREAQLDYPKRRGWSIVKR
jgi:hypothetical protein